MCKFGHKLFATGAARLRSERGVLNLVQTAVTLPIFLVLTFGAGYLYYYVRNFMVLGYAAERAAEIASAPAGTLQIEERPIENLPVRMEPDKQSFEQCLNGDFVTCFSNLAQSRKSAIAYHGAKSQGINGIPNDNIEELPFALFEKPTRTPGYYPVQTLPLVGIEFGCFETFNDTGANIPSNPKRLLLSPALAQADPGACRHVRPMYWQNPVRADFDGDRREDLVFFKPNGTNESWGSEAPRSDSDFIVYLSSYGYSGIGGHGYYNLAAEPPDSNTALPYHPIPIVADYDRDALSDYGVFEPGLGEIRIALSRSNYKLIVRTTIDSACPDFTSAFSAPGLAAIPGQYRESYQTDVAIVKSAGAAQSRWDICLTNLSGPIQNELANPANLALSSTTVIDIDSGATIKTQPYQKPHPALAAVPAFGDYDGDGITEVGYLSYRPGSDSRRAGLAPAPNAPDSELSSFSLVPTENGPTPPDKIRMNPFDMAEDGAGELLYIDSVEGKLWKITSEDGHAVDDISAGEVEAVMPLDSGKSPGSITESSFPVNNILNTPTLPALTDSDDNDKPAGQRKLSWPRKIAVAKGYDNATYITDWGHGRIVRIEADSSGKISESSNSKIILGGSDCIRNSGSCASLPLNTSFGSSPTGYNVWPSAITTMPDPAQPGKYLVLFSSQTQIFALQSGTGALGPTGSALDKIFLIAGTGSTSPQTGVANTLRRFVPQNFPVPPATASSNIAICPASDLLYDTNRSVLFAALSCDQQINRSGTLKITNANNVGGIIRIQPAAGASFVQTNPSNTVSLFVGGFYSFPCLTQLGGDIPKCAGTGQVSTPFRRQIDLSADAAKLPLIDVVNPVDLAFAPDGRLLMVNQWTEGAKIDLAGSRIGDLFNRGVYAITIDNATKTAKAIATYSTAPATESEPYRNPYWKFAHSNAQGELEQYLDSPHESTDIGFANASSAVLTTSSGELFSAVAFTQNPATLSEAVKAQNVGAIFARAGDTDGDGIPDNADQDLDGDQVASDPDTNNPNLIDPVSGDPTAAEYRHKLMLPRQYFFKISDRVKQVFLPGEQETEGEGDPAKNYGEYFFSSARPGLVSVPSETSIRTEPWNLFLAGDEYLDINAERPDCESGNLAEGAEPCAGSMNGPIALVGRLNVFEDSHVATDFVAVGNFTKTATPTLLEEATHPAVELLVPSILSNTKVSATSLLVSQARIADSSALPCASIGTKAFRRSPSNNNQFNCSLNGEQPLNYRRFEWSELTLPVNSPTEALTLHWPTQLVSGSLFDLSGTRQFLLLDTDGDGAGNPSFLSTESYSSIEGRDSPYVFHSLDLQGSSSAPGIRAAHEMAASRGSSVGIETLRQLGYSTAGTLSPLFSLQTNSESLSETITFDTSEERGTAPDRESIAASLDLEIQASRSDGQNGFARNRGAAEYFDYVVSNRYKISNEDQSPALTGAKRILEESLNLPAPSITTDKSTFESAESSAEALLSFVDRSGNSCDGNSEIGCAGVRIKRKLSIFGKMITIERVAWFKTTAASRQDS